MYPFPPTKFEQQSGEVKSNNKRRNSNFRHLTIDFLRAASTSTSHNDLKGGDRTREEKEKQRIKVPSKRIECNLRSGIGSLSHQYMMRCSGIAEKRSLVEKDGILHP